MTRIEMKLTVLNSGSRANGYVLQNDNEALLIECGCPVSDALRAIDFSTEKIVGCLVSHEHGDHSKYVEKYLDYMRVYCSEGTAQSLQCKKKRKLVILKPFKRVSLGNYTIIPFDTKHDTNEPFGFLIEHKEIGKLLFATDTYYIKYCFDGLTNVMIECNYDKKILFDNVEKGVLRPFVRDRIMRSHLSLDTCIKTLKANDLSKVSQVVLLHLSSNNSDAERFKEIVQSEIGKKVVVATKGLEIDLNETPF